jgi:hypothetical protein
MVFLCLYPRPLEWTSTPAFRVLTSANPSERGKANDQKIAPANCNPPIKDGDDGRFFRTSAEFLIVAWQFLVVVRGECQIPYQRWNAELPPDLLWAPFCGLPGRRK